MNTFPDINLYFQGAIFGISYYENLLSTVGDDRTIKLYNLHHSLQLLSSFFAHEARIWQSCITSTHLLTCGEDSSIRLWSHKSTGELLRCFSVHRCKSVWCMDILRDDNNDKPLIIISGWSDGGVRRYHLDDVPIDSHEPISLNKIIENDYPRNVIFFHSLIMIIQMNSGQLIKIDQDHFSLFYDGRNTLKNGYAKMSVSNDGNPYLAVGSLNGSVFILDQNGLIKNEFQIEINRNNKILQILWLNNTLSSKLLVCIPDGIMVNRRISFLRAISQRFRREKKAILSFLLRVIFFSRSLTIFHHSSLINLFAVCDVIFTGFLSEQMVGVQLESKSS
jgi:WD40 repeat protein